MKALVEYKRSGLAEVRKFGSLFWSHGNKKIHSCGENRLVYARSTAKPFHLKAVAKDLDKVLSWEEKALSIASHTAETSHLKVLEKILKAKYREYLQVPPSLSLFLDQETPKKSERSYHPCSGEHSALIRACLENKWPLENYTAREHPFHQVFLKQIRSVLGSDWQTPITAVDGCGLLTFAFTLHELASLFASLARRKDEDWIWDAMIRHPYLVGGRARLDTAILESCEGKVLAKEGADGLLGLSVLHPDYPEGLGIFIKLDHGTDPQAMWCIAHEILRSLGWTIPEPPKPFRQEVCLNLDILPLYLQKTSRKHSTRK